MMNSVVLINPRQKAKDGWKDRQTLPKASSPCFTVDNDDQCKALEFL